MKKMTATPPIYSKGIVLAGGMGSRLYPATLATSKHLLPVYDKPMIYYPLSTLMLAGVRDILIITTPADHGAYEQLLGDGSRIGMTICYATQSEPRGLADAFLVGRDFIGSDHVVFILGDNFFHGPGFQAMLTQAASSSSGATVFTHRVENPQSFGILEQDAEGNILSLEEKPTHPKSNLAVVGLYFYDNQVVEIAAHHLAPSSRGELEITDVNREYFRRGQLRAQPLGSDVAWFDMGTPDALMQASRFVKTTEAQQGKKIACIEEIAYQQGWIDAPQLETLSRALDNDYGCYLRKCLDA